MKAQSKIVLPSIFGPEWMYGGAKRREDDCTGCPLRLSVPLRGLFKCRATGDYEVPEVRPQACPCPTKPELVQDGDILRPVCPSGSAIIDLKIIHWTRREEVAKGDILKGCIPATIGRGGKAEALPGFSLEVHPMGDNRSPWSYYRLTWKKEV